MPGFGGFASVGEGYDQGAESYWKRRQLENQPLIDAAALRGLQALQMPGAQQMQPGQGGPMPGGPQPGQPPMGFPGAQPAPGGPQPGMQQPGGPQPGGLQASNLTQPSELVGLKPGSFGDRFSGAGPSPGFVNPGRVAGQPQNLTGPIIPPGGFGGGPQQPSPPAPQQERPQPQPQGQPPQQQGQMNPQLGMQVAGFVMRNPIASAIVRANPGAPPEVIMGAITKAMPLMQNDAIQQWRELQTQVRYDQMGNQAGIAAGHDQTRRDVVGQQTDAQNYRANLAADLKRDAQKGLNERAELSSDTRLALGGLSAKTKLEIAGQLEAGRDKRAELSADTKKELAGMNITARKELQEYLEGGRMERAAQAETGKGERQERGLDAASMRDTAKSESAMDRLRTGLQAKGENIVAKGEIDKDKQARDQEFKRQLDASRQAQVNERLKFATSAKSDILKQTLTERADLQKKRMDAADARTDKVVEERYDRTNKAIAAAQERLNQRRGSPEDVKLVAQSIAEYRQAPIGSNPMLMAEVQRINPQYNAANWAPMQRMLGAFAAGPEGRTARSLYVADHHIGRLIEAAAGLNNTQSTTWNWAMNYLAKEFNTEGQPRTFDAVKQFIAGEIVKAGSGVTGGGVQERMHLMNNIDTNASLESIVSTAKALQQLLKDQAGGLKRQYEGQPGAPKDFERRFGFEPTDLELQKNTAVKATAAKKTDSVLDRIGYSPQWYTDAKKKQYGGFDDSSIPAKAQPRSYQKGDPLSRSGRVESGGRIGAGGTSGKPTVAPNYGLSREHKEYKRLKDMGLSDQAIKEDFSHLYDYVKANPLPK